MTRRLVLSYLAITVVVLVLLEVPLAVFYQQRELDRLTVNAERDATVLATIYEESLEENFPPDPQPADDYAARTGARVVVVDVDGISTVDSGAEVDRDFSTRSEIEVALGGQRASGTRRSDTLDTDLLYVAVPVASGGVVYGALRLTLDTHEVTERIQRFWIGLLAIAAVVLILMSGIGWLIARSVTRPVRRLQLAADRFSDGDLTPTEPNAGAPPELAALEAALNTMASRLDELLRRQRAFVADASHQLRTPLTALRLRLENLQSEASDQATEEELADAISETTRLADLVGDLLQLARAERPAELVAIDLTRHAADRVDVWSATAEQTGVRVELRAPAEHVGTNVVPGGIEQVLDNLLDNAIRASPPGSIVDVIVATEPDSTSGPTSSVTVVDRGPGLSDEDKARALGRFWRADQTTPGTGLGLPIAQVIVAASGGTIGLRDNRPSGLAVTVAFPAHVDRGTTTVAAAGGREPS